MLELETLGKVVADLMGNLLSELNRCCPIKSEVRDGRCGFCMGYLYRVNSRRHHLRNLENLILLDIPMQSKGLSLYANSA